MCVYFIFQFLRDELQYVNGNERRKGFHRNDKHISLSELWHSWKSSEGNFNEMSCVIWIFCIFMLFSITIQFVFMINTHTHSDNLKLPRLKVPVKIPVYNSFLSCTTSGQFASLILIVIHAMHDLVMINCEVGLSFIPILNFSYLLSSSSNPPKSSDKMANTFFCVIYYLVSNSPICTKKLILTKNSHVI